MVSYLMVAGMSLIISGMNMVNFGQGAFFALGTYITYTVSSRFGFGWSLLIAPAIVGIIGFLVEKVTRPLFGKNMLYIMLLTFGTAYIICDGIAMIWGYSIRLIALPDFLNGAVSFFGIMFPLYYIFIIAVASLIAFTFWFMMNKTRLGMLMRAIISDKDMVGDLGVNVNMLFSVMFMIGTALAGFGGVLNAPITGMSPKEGLSVLGNIMPILMIGGMKNMNACLPAAILVGLTNAFGAIYMPQYYNLIPAILMVICMMIKPDGIFTKEAA